MNIKVNKDAMLILLLIVVSVLSGLVYGGVFQINGTYSIMVKMALSMINVYLICEIVKKAPKKGYAKSLLLDVYYVKGGSEKPSERLNIE